MITLIEKGNYFFITFSENKPSIKGLKTDFEIIPQNDGTYDINRKNIAEVENIAFSGFSPDGVTAFASVDAFETFAFANTGYGNFNSTNGSVTESISTPYKLISAASTNANVVKAKTGKLSSIIAIGLTSTVRYLKLYNKATSPTVGTDTPVMTIPIPANTQGAGVCLPFSMGVNFSNGISIAITASAADSDNTPIGAGDVIINLTSA